MNHSNCPVVASFVLLSKRWVLLLLRAALGGTSSFNAFKRQLGAISSRTLSARLRELESAKYLTRIITATSPIKIEYHPTPKSQALEKHLEKLAAWAREWEGK